MLLHSILRHFDTRCWDTLTYTNEMLYAQYWNTLTLTTETLVYTYILCKSMRVHIWNRIHTQVNTSACIWEKHTHTYILLCHIHIHTKFLHAYKLNIYTYISETLTHSPMKTLHIYCWTLVHLLLNFLYFTCVHTSSFSSMYA